MEAKTSIQLHNKTATNKTMDIFSCKRSPLKSLQNVQVKINSLEEKTDAPNPNTTTSRLKIDSATTLLYHKQLSNSRNNLNTIGGSGKTIDFNDFFDSKEKTIKRSNSISEGTTSNLGFFFNLTDPTLGTIFRDRVLKDDNNCWPEIQHGTCLDTSYWFDDVMLQTTLVSRRDKENDSSPDSNIPIVIGTKNEYNSLIVSRIQSAVITL